MSNRHPWTAWYWDEWDTDTVALSDSEYAIYHRLLKHYYKSQKPLEANATGLPRLCSAHTKAQLAAMELVLVKFFTLQPDGCYHNKRADIELERMLNVSSERAEAGRRGGNAKAKNVANATKLPEQKRTHPQPHIQLQEKRESNPLPQYSESDYRKRDHRRLAKAKAEITFEIKSGDPCQQVTDADYMSRVCERSGLTPSEVMQLEKELKWPIGVAQ